jgi:nicotinamidase-related amidase
MTHARSALLLMDLMPIVVPAFGGDDVLLENARRASEAARASGCPVVHVRVRFRTDYPDIATDNLIFGPLSQHFDFTESNPETRIHQRVQPQDTDLLVTKRRVSAFAGSDLDLVLRSRDVDHLVLSGVATSGVVLSTLRQAADLDFKLTVLADACADGDPELHEMLLTKVFPQQAQVLSADEWITSA